MDFLDSPADVPCRRQEVSAPSASDVPADLVETTPGDEGKWFTAAKDAGLFQKALALACGAQAV